MRGWKALPLPLGVTLDESGASTMDAPTYRQVHNAVFDFKGGVKGRPGYERLVGYVNRAISSVGDPTTPSVTAGSIPGTFPTSFAVRDKRGERPGLVTEQAILTREDGTWVGRLGAGACKVTRVTDLTPGLAPAGSASGTPANTVPACAFDFGPGPNLPSYASWSLLTAAGDRDRETPMTNTVGCGTSARSGTTTCMLYVKPGTNSLYLATRANGARAITETLISSVAATPTGYGDAPVICCDSDSTLMFIAYKTTTVHQVTCNKVSVNGVISATANVTFGAGVVQGLWITNSSQSDNRVVLGITDSVTTGVFTRVFDQALNNQAIDVTLDGASAMRGPVVCGAAASGIVWFAWLEGGLASSGKGLAIQNRSITAATTGSMSQWAGTDPGTVTPSYAPFGWYLQHQPVLLRGRVILGLAVATGGTNCTWYDVDITDLWHGSTGYRSNPPLVARSDYEGVAIPFNPTAATLSTDAASFRFPVIEWRQFQAVTPVGSFPTGQFGSNGTLGPVEVSFIKPQVAYLNDTTIIGGSIPRALARGDAYDLGFPFQARPSIGGATGGAGGLFTAGTYNVVAVWKWTDEAGQVHRSSPSLSQTITLALNDKLSVTATNCMMSDKTYAGAGAASRLKDRGGISTEIYVTKTNPTAKAAHYLLATLDQSAIDVTSVTMVNPPAGTELPLYSDGGVLPNRPVSADGGVVSVGNRCWMSDGDAVYASKLGTPGQTIADGPAWNDDGPLTIVVPPVAGQVIALAALDDKLVIGCQRGIFITTGDGPDDLGQGQDFATPVRISDSGVDGTRCMMGTPKGVVFRAANTQADSVTGGLWVIDRGLSCNQVSWNVRSELGTTAGDLAYIQERELLVYLNPTGNIVLWDLRANCWMTWDRVDSMASVAAVTGVLWGSGSGVAGAFDLTPGNDTTDVTAAYAMTIALDTCPANGSDNLGWAKIRSITMLGDGAYSGSWTVTVVLDGSRTMTKTDALVEATNSTTWPSNRVAPEWRINQKASTFAPTVSCSPAPANPVTHLHLQIRPSDMRAPARDRSALH